MQTTDFVDQSSLRTDHPDFVPGDTLKVHVRVVEGSKERIQLFQGVVIRRSGGGLQETFTVRKVSYGVGVERTFPLHTPTIATAMSRAFRFRTACRRCSRSALTASGVSSGRLAAGASVAAS